MFNNEENSSKNFIIAMILFMAVMFGYEYFSGDKNQNTETQKTEEIAQAKQEPVKEEVPDEKFLSMDDALKSVNRVSLENSHMLGSINLSGGIIDSIILKDYK